MMHPGHEATLSHEEEEDDSNAIAVADAAAVAVAVAALQAPDSKRDPLHSTSISDSWNTLKNLCLQFGNASMAGLLERMSGAKGVIAHQSDIIDAVDKAVQFIIGQIKQGASGIGTGVFNGVGNFRKGVGDAAANAANGIKQGATAAATAAATATIAAATNILGGLPSTKKLSNLYHYINELRTNISSSDADILSIIDLRNIRNFTDIKDIVRGYSNTIHNSECVVMIPPEVNNWKNWMIQWRKDGKNKCKWFLFDADYIIEKRQRHVKTTEATILFAPDKLFDENNDDNNSIYNAIYEGKPIQEGFEKTIFLRICSHYGGLSIVVSDTSGDTSVAKYLVDNKIWANNAYLSTNGNSNNSYTRVSRGGEHEQQSDILFNETSLEYRLECLWDGNKGDIHNKEVGWNLAYLFTLKCLREYIEGKDTNRNNRLPEPIQNTQQINSFIERSVTDVLAFVGSKDRPSSGDPPPQYTTVKLTAAEKAFRSNWWGDQGLGIRDTRDTLFFLFEKLKKLNKNLNFPEAITELVDQRTKPGMVTELIQFRKFELEKLPSVLKPSDIENRLKTFSNFIPSDQMPIEDLNKLFQDVKKTFYTPGVPVTQATPGLPVADAKLLQVADAKLLQVAQAMPMGNKH